MLVGGWLPVGNVSTMARGTLPGYTQVQSGAIYYSWILNPNYKGVITTTPIWHQKVDPIYKCGKCGNLADFRDILHLLQLIVSGLESADGLKSLVRFQFKNQIASQDI